MDWGHLVAFNVALIAAMLSPGPALLLALRTAITSGRLAGIATGAGLGLMASLWTLAALVGLDLVFALFPWAYLALKTVGALYLIYLAWCMWRDAHKPLTANPTPARRAFRTGFLVNLSNPKSVLFASAVLVVIFPRGLSLGDKLLVWANHFAVELLVYTAFSLLLTTPAARRAYLGAKPWLDRGAAAVMGALGLRLLISK